MDGSKARDQDGRERLRAHARKGGLWLAASALVGGALLAGAPARAGDFEDGFQDQMGRIVAVQVFRMGQVLLSGVADPYAYGRAPYGHHPRYGAPPAYGHRPHAHHPVAYPVAHRRPVARRHHAHPHPVAYPGTTVVVQSAPQSPCSQHQHTAPAPNPAPYGERIVYERYERTVLPPPETVVVPESRGPAAATRLRY